MHLALAAMPPRTVHITDKGASFFAFARIKGVFAEKWEDGALPRDAVPFDKFLCKLPFAFGRERRDDAGLGITSDESSWLVIDSSTCSRVHAVLRFDEGSQRYMLKVLSANGADVNRAFFFSFPAPRAQLHILPL